MSNTIVVKDNKNFNFNIVESFKIFINIISKNYNNSKYLLNITTSDISKKIIEITPDRKNNIVLDNVINCNLNKVSY